MKSSWLMAAALAWTGGVAAAAVPESPLTAASTAVLADCNAAAFATVLQAAPGETAAAAHWLAQGRIRWPGPTPAAVEGGSYALAFADAAALLVEPGSSIGGPRARASSFIPLRAATEPLPPALAARFAFVAPGVDLQLPAAALARAPALLRGALQLVQTDAQGRVLRATGLQLAGVLDELYARAATLPDLGVTVARGHTAFQLWAPTAQRVALCLHADGTAPARQILPMRRDASTGAWKARRSGDLTNQTYTYLVDVFVRGTGWVRNRVTDPYSISLNADSKRSWIGRLDTPALQPAGWADAPRPQTVKRVQAATDLVIYELHLRDFSASDTSVPAAHRGKYGAFTATASHGMRHLQALAAAGVTDVHLLPVFDFATVPEQGCSTPDAAALAGASADSPSQQATVMAAAAGDCYNWGYDPLHFGAPEGSYANDAADGAVRIREFRAMVQALHRAGLRVGMDMVYNHSSASGQNVHSVLDRVVPGYYQRLNAQGGVETSTCCANTATEHRMMAKLMVDTAVVWARDYRIDSMRFDLMGHQPRAAMEQLQQAVDRAAGRHIHLVGEGWNFGEVANGARFVQASQGSLNGSGIATFSDRGRDAVRGGGCCDNTPEAVARQGWLNGQFYAPNASGAVAAAASAASASAAPPATRDELLRSADLVRVGLAGTLRSVRMTTRDGSVRALADIDYASQPAGYASQPGEVVNYVENHDNPTLFDINVLKLPQATSREDRARVQVLGLAVTAFSQGIAYFHAGVELLRSKSGDRNSFDSGDWFNRLDWTATDNHFGSGLPPQADNGPLWPVLKPLLANPAIKPGPAEIAFTRDAFLDLLRIRSSSTLFRLRTADEVAARLTLHNTGPAQEPTVVVGQLDGRGLAGAGFAELLYAINVNPQQVVLPLPELRGRAYRLHPVHRAAGAADKRPAEASSWDAASGTLTLPPRTALVYVQD
jgi:pullulanase-type alpha-1,6-glucosidase